MEHLLYNFLVFIASFLTIVYGVPTLINIINSSGLTNGKTDMGPLPNLIMAGVGLSMIALLIFGR